MKSYSSLVAIPLIATTLTLIASTPRSAEACSPPACWPSAALVPGAGVTVPANLPALYWRPVGGRYMPVPGDPAQLFFGTDALAIGLTPKMLDGGSYELGLTAPLTPGKTYRLIDPTVCNGWMSDAGAPTDGGPDQGNGPPTPGVLDVTFTAGPAAALPQSLGTLTSKALGQAPLVVGTAMGSCDIEIEAARVEVTLQLADEAKPWASVLHFETLVDGKSWHGVESINSVYPPGASWRGRGADVLYAICGAQKGAFPGVGEGSHQVVFRATLPGTQLVLTTAPTTVRIDCASDGCSVAARAEHGRSSLGSLALLCLAMALFVAGRRRRARRPDGCR